MPVDLTAETVRDALAVMQEWDRDAAMDADAALQWMGWEEEAGELRLRRHDVALFVWYQLPRKFLASLDRKRAAAAGLGRFLELLGGRAASYADVCRAAETDRLLVAWEREDPDAPRRLRALLDASGTEPPDTELLEWGSVMGLEEARVREHVALALEEAIEEGRLTPGERGFRRRQADVVALALREPHDGDPRLTRLEAVQAERLERWLERGHAGGSEERRAIVQRVAPIVSGDPAPIEAAPAREALAPVLWLLDQAEGGIRLTQTGALNRALVRELVERWPGWWDAELFGPPNREDEVALLHELRELLVGIRLMRRAGPRMVSTKRGRTLRQAPERLLQELATALLGGTTFAAAAAELAAALMLDGAEASATTLAPAIRPALAAEGWRAGGEQPTDRDVAWAVGGFLLGAEAIGLLASERRERRRVRVLTPAGRAGLAAGLRARAIAPASGI